MYYFVYAVYLFFFFKQKTAYEMRISDWSSDVCSSDLPARPQRFEITDQDILTEPIIGARQSTGLQIGQPAIDRLRIGLQEIRVTSAVRKRVEIGVDEALILARQSAIGTGGADIVQIGIDRSLVRSEERRVGKECVRTGRSRWSPCH